MAANGCGAAENRAEAAVSVVISFSVALHRGDYNTKNYYRLRVSLRGTNYAGNTDPKQQTGRKIDRARGDGWIVG